MRFYHANATQKELEKMREMSSKIKHGIEATPKTCHRRKDKWFLDNGAFTDDFNKESWIKTLDKCKGYDNKPDFVVLPDVFDKPVETIKRNWEYVEEVRKRGLDYYCVAQKPMKPDTAVQLALGLEADGIFVGGSWNWKQKTTSKIVDSAHKHGLKVHIGMPKDYFWAYKTGADSMDSANIVRNQNYKDIKELEDRLRTQVLVTQY